jgi:FkbM family methyltransferase
MSLQSRWAERKFGTHQYEPEAGCQILLNMIISVSKNDLSFRVEYEEGEPAETFWKEAYHDWEPGTFKVFDKYANPNGVVIDIGCWIGPTALYLAQKSRRVIAVESNRQANATLSRNVALNSLEPKFELIEKAIYSDNSGVRFGTNPFRPSEGLMHSTCQILPDDTPGNDQTYLAPTITWAEITSHLRPGESVSLIKMDIEGGEQFVIRDVLQWAYDHYVPAYISFHVDWWIDKDLNRLTDLFALYGDADARIASIQASPFKSILFKRQKPKPEPKKTLGRRIKSFFKSVTSASAR